MKKLNISVLLALALILAFGLVACKQGPTAYVVRFNVNLAGSEQTMPDQEFKYGETMPLYANEFEYKGHVFTGWNTASDGSGTRYYDGQEVKNLTSEDGAIFTLYAQWAEDDFIGTEWIAAIDETTTLRIMFGDGRDTGKAKIFWSKSISPDLPYFEGSYVEKDRMLYFRDVSEKEPAGTEYAYYSMETNLVLMDDDPDLHVKDIKFERNLDEGCFNYPTDMNSVVISDLINTHIATQERSFVPDGENYRFSEGDMVSHLVSGDEMFSLEIYYGQEAIRKTGTEGEWMLKTTGDITVTFLMNCRFFIGSDGKCSMMLHIPDLNIPYGEYTFVKQEPEA